MSTRRASDRLDPSRAALIVHDACRSMKMYARVRTLEQTLAMPG